jgi:NAD(P)-dependent dehydrogenase (short-subunit alcohol dehydrogenase family)
MRDFSGKVAVITGAGSGFGREFAVKAASLGMRLALADIDRDALAQTERMLGEAPGIQILTQQVDVSDGAQVESLAARVLERFGEAHLLFNNAGVAAGGFVWEATENDWRWVLGVNLMGVVNGLRAFVPIMLRQNCPCHIVNTASVAGLISPRGLGPYNASKHAVVTLSETLHQDLKLVGAQIGVSVLCPGFVKTGIADSARNRPTELGNQGGPTRSQQVSAERVRQAMETSRLSATDIANLTFDAIAAGQFYIVPHPEYLKLVALRLQDILALRAPTDPMAATEQQT